MYSRKTIFLSFLAIGLFVLAFFLRSSIFLSGDFLFLPDQARDFLLVRNMVEERKPPLIGARVMSGGLFFHGPIWIWILGIPFMLFNGDPYMMSWTFVFVSMAIVISGFVVALMLYGWRVALLVTLFLSISIPLAGSVSAMSNAHVMPLVFVWYLYFLIRFIRGDTRFLYLAAIAAGVGMHFQGIFSAPLFLYLLAIFVLVKRDVFAWKRLFLPVFCFFIPLSTHMLFDLRHDFLMTRAVLKMFMNTEKALPAIKGYEQYEDTWFRIGDRMGSMVQVPFSVIPNSSWVIYSIIVFCLIICIYTIFRKKLDVSWRRELIVLSVIPIFVYVTYIIFPYPIWGHYVYSIPVVMSLVLSLPLVWFSRIKLGWIVPIMLLLLILPTLFTSIRQLYFSGIKHGGESDGSFRNQLAIVDDVFEKGKDKNFGYFVYTPQVFTYGVDYLMWWRGKTRFGYIPPALKKNQYFLIMYPPLKNDNGAHDFWKKKVLRVQGSLVQRKEYHTKIVMEQWQAGASEDSVDPNYYMDVR